MIFAKEIVEILGKVKTSLRYKVVGIMARRESLNLGFVPFLFFSIDNLNWGL